MWIGRGRREAHAVLGAAARCLTERCPAGWRVGRVQAAAAADRLWVITRLARRELERVVEALSHATER